MKKTIAIILVILCVVSIFAYFYVKNVQLEKKQVSKFNAEYESYNTDKILNGLDITTLINKATSNNEKYEISKDEEGYYILDDKYSIEIYITMIINEKTYKMERINALGMNAFIEYFGPVGFKCTNVEYHESTGRIASMTFEATEY